MYTSHGYTEREAMEYGSAEEADCQDVGRDSAGSVFSGSSGQVTTWTFAGYPSTKVLGVRFNKKSFAVFVADSVARQERDRIYEELGQAAR